MMQIPTTITGPRPQSPTFREPVLSQEALQQHFAERLIINTHPASISIIRMLPTRTAHTTRTTNALPPHPAAPQPAQHVHPTFCTSP